jgi:hypothetical protein
MAAPFTFLLPVLLLFGATAFAAESFDYSVDRFEADGNVNGPFDGTPDVVDEFDDGMLAPWFVRTGSVAETGGLLHVRSPGQNTSLPGIFPVAFSASAAGRNGVLHTGNGDGVLRVVLSQQAIGANDAVSFDLSTIEGQALYYAGIVLTNFNSSLANSFTPPYPVGLAVTAHAERLSFTNTVLAREHHPLDPASVTGPIVLELRYDDAARQITPAISVDGGSTFDAAFAPLDVETDSGAVTTQVAVAALEGKCPAAQSIREVRITRLDRPSGRQRLKVRLDHPSDLLRSNSHPIRLVLTDLGAGAATVYDITIPDGITTFQHACDPRDGYVANGYVNYSNALPPDCVAGSAHGLRRMSGRWNGHLDLKFDVRETSIPSVTGPIRATIYDGTGPVNECDGWVGEAPCKASAKGARCQP